MSEELSLEIENLKVGSFRMSGEVYFIIGDSGTYCSLPSEDELVDYELYDHKGDPLDDEIENNEELKSLLLEKVIKLYKEQNDLEEEEEPSDSDHYLLSEEDEFEPYSDDHW